MTDGPPPLPADGPLEQPGGLFGAAVAAGRWDPVPVLALAGADVASGPGVAGALMAMDGLSLHWGRDDVLDQPEPATGTVRIFDPTRTWAMGQQIVGMPVTLRYVGVRPDTHVEFSRVFFKGRVSNVRVSPKTAAGIDGTVVELSLTSILADLANRIPAAAWPAETMGARSDRIAVAAADVLPGGVTMRTYWRAPEVAPVAAADHPSLLEHLEAVFDSSGADRYTYFPAIDRAEYLSRREYADAVRGLSRLWWDTTGSGGAREAQGAYIRTRTQATEDAQPAFVLQPLYLDSRDLEYDPGDGLFRSASARITRVQVVHPDAAVAYADRTEEVAVPGVNEAVMGVRTARMDSLVAWNSYAAVSASDLQNIVGKEGAAWRTEPLKWRSARARGFETFAQADWMLHGAETPNVVFLQRSWLPRYGLRPVFGLMGAQVTYTAESWDMELNMAPVITRGKQHPISWSEIDDGSAGYRLEWHDGPHPRALHETVTYEDMGHVSVGMVPGDTVGPDQGWDFYA